MVSRRCAMRRAGIGGMAVSFLYLASRALLGALAPQPPGLHVNDIELLVLRHELEILHRRVARAKLALSDRALLAAADWQLPRSSVVFFGDAAGVAALASNTAQFSIAGQQRTATCRFAGEPAITTATCPAELFLRSARGLSIAEA